MVLAHLLEMKDFAETVLEDVVVCFLFRQPLVGGTDDLEDGGVLDLLLVLFWYFLLL